MPLSLPFRTTEFVSQRYSIHFLFVELFPRILTTRAKKCASHLDVQPNKLNRDNIMISTMFGHDNIQTWFERDGVMTTNTFCFCVLLLFPSHTDNLRSEHWSGTCTLGSWKNCGRNLPDLMWQKTTNSINPYKRHKEWLGFGGSVSLYLPAFQDIST